MGLKDELIDLIEKHKDTGFFSGPVSEESIQEVEKSLNVSLPKSYKWFLRNYGSGGTFGVEIYGVAKNGNLTVVERTKDYREYGLPPSYVIIQNFDEYQMCLDTSKMKDGECPVVDWDMTFGARQMQEEYRNFYEYLKEQIEESLEDMEDDVL